MFYCGENATQPDVCCTLRKWRVAMKSGVSFSWFFAHCSAKGDKASKHSWLISELILNADVKEQKLQNSLLFFLSFTAAAGKPEISNYVTLSAADFEFQANQNISVKCFFVLRPGMVCIFIGVQRQQPSFGRDINTISVLTLLYFTITLFHLKKFSN